MKSCLILALLILGGWGAALDVAAAMPEPGGNPDWASITVLNLDTAITIALRDNPGLEAATARVHQAKAQVEQARAAYWPRLDANASAARVDLSEATYQENLALARLFNASISNPEESYHTDLTASWTLFDGFERKFTTMAARYGERSSAAALNDARRLLAAAVAQAYFSAQLALENITIAKADEAFNQRQLADAEARQRVGTGALSDVLNFQVRKNQAKTSRINQESQYTVSRFGLAALLGLPESRLPDAVQLAPLAPETDTEMAHPPLDGLIAAALDHRSDIKALHWQVQQAQAQIEVARSGYYPSVALSGAVEGDRSGDADFGQDDFGNRVQLGLSYNLFSGGYTRAKVQEVRQRKLELEKTLADQCLSTTADIRRAATRVATAQTQVTLQRENVDLVQRTRDLVEKEYNAGQGSLVRLNEAQKDLTTAQSNLALALVGLRQAWVELRTQAGTLLADLAL